MSRRIISPAASSRWWRWPARCRATCRLLLLDEPFEGLAPTVILELFKVFDLLRRHTSIVIVEHNLDLVLALADRVFALERGAVFHQGPGGAAVDRSGLPQEDLVAVMRSCHSGRCEASNPESRRIAPVWSFAPSRMTEFRSRRRDANLTAVMAGSMALFASHAMQPTKK